MTLKFLRHQYHALHTAESHRMCQQCFIKHKTLRQKRRQKIFTQPSIYLYLLCLALGWQAVFHYGHRIHSSYEEVQIWDPHHLLGVSSYSSIAHIKHQYKWKSLQHHPDKRRKDGISKEEAEAEYMEITKAYKVYISTGFRWSDHRLTDPVIRENYLRWSHPDGRQEYSLGISLPITFVNDDEQMSWLMAFGYVAVLNFVAFWTGFWWLKAQSKTKGGLQGCTAHMFFVTSSQNRMGHMDICKMVKLMSRCYEITQVVAKFQKNKNIERLVHLYPGVPLWREIMAADDYNIPVVPSTLVANNSLISSPKGFCLPISIGSLFLRT